MRFDHLELLLKVISQLLAAAAGLTVLLKMESSQYRSNVDRRVLTRVGWLQTSAIASSIALLLVSEYVAHLEKLTAEKERASETAALNKQLSTIMDAAADSAARARQLQLAPFTLHELWVTWTAPADDSAARRGWELAVQQVRSLRFEEKARRDNWLKECEAGASGCWIFKAFGGVVVGRGKGDLSDSSDFQPPDRSEYFALAESTSSAMVFPVFMLGSGVIPKSSLTSAANTEWASLTQRTSARGDELVAIRQFIETPFRYDQLDQPMTFMGNKGTWTLASHEDGVTFSAQIDIPALATTVSASLMPTFAAGLTGGKPSGATVHNSN